MNWVIRMFYAVIVFVIFVYVTPLFCAVIGLPLAGDVWQLLRILAGCAAVAYVAFGPAPPRPWA